MFPNDLNEFREIWLVKIDFEERDGEPPSPTGLRAREYRTGLEVRLDGQALRNATATPFDTSEQCLYVAYQSEKAIGCHLALGWSVPKQILDLHGEFRCRSAGVLEPGDYDLAAAMKHCGLEGDGLDALGKLLEYLLTD